MNQEVVKTETSLVIIPQEVKSLAERVAIEKRDEVNIVLNQLFSGTENWKTQISSIVVKDHTDIMSMQLADTARLNVKKARLEAEKLFDAKRDEVQKIKLEYDLEDKLWLKSKQIMQEMFKSIEKEAEYKANTLERYNIEQKEKRTQIRLEKASAFNPQISRFDIENLSDEMFDAFLFGLESDFNKKVEEERLLKLAQIEQEKKLATFNSRRLVLSKMVAYTGEEILGDLSLETTEEEFIIMLEFCNNKKSEWEAKQEKIKAEKLEAERKLEQERKRIQEEKEKMLAEQKKKDDERRKVEAEMEAERKKIEAEKKRIEAEKQAEINAKLEKERIEKEAELNKSKMSDKQKMEDFVNSFSAPEPPSLNDSENMKALVDIMDKFNGFRNWALKRIS